MAEALLGLGSNLGDRQTNLAEALRRIAIRCPVLEVSSIYRTEPVGYRDQEWFFNTVARVAANAPAAELLTFCATIEDAMGRRRTIPNGPRTIDIDILLLDQLSLVEGALRIPHPRMQQRRFVLEPAAEIAAGWQHPILGLTLADLLKDLPQDEAVEKLTVPGWPPSTGP